MTRADALRERMGPGPARIVAPFNPPRMAVWAANQALAIQPVSAPYGDVMLGLYGRRVDLVCMNVFSGIPEFQVFTGTTAAYPSEPRCPEGWIPLATIMVYASQTVVQACDITEVRP